MLALHKLMYGNETKLGAATTDIHVQYRQCLNQGSRSYGISEMSFPNSNSVYLEVKQTDKTTK